jgi:ABC-2 type transport system permease protein
METAPTVQPRPIAVQPRPLIEWQPIYSMWKREIIRFFSMRARVFSFIVSPFTWLVFLGIPLSRMMPAGQLHLGIPFFSFIVPGVLGMGLLFGGMNSGVTVLWDKEFGFLKEVMVAPVRRISLIMGRSLGALTINILQALITLAVALVAGIWLGFSINSLGGFFLALVFVVLTFFAAVGFGLTLGAIIEETEGYMTIVRVIEMPLFFLSGGLLPVSALKGIPILFQVQFLNPLTYGVDGIRGAFSGVYLISFSVDIAVVAVCAVVFLTLGAYAFSKMEVG